MEPPRARPPRWAVAIIRRAVPSGPSREGLLGDLEEQFRRRLEGGYVRACLWYGREAVMSAVRYGVEHALPQGSRNGEGRGMEGWIRDLRMGVRGLRRHPGFSALVIATLALGMGATAAVF